jgi:hypothetical protein
MPAIPGSTNTSLAQRLHAHARNNWLQRSGVTVRYRGPFAYVDGEPADGEILPLMRLRYSGPTTRWGFAIYLASNTTTPTQPYPTGILTAGSPQDALDCACNLHITPIDL